MKRLIELNWRKLLPISIMVVSIAVALVWAAGPSLAQVYGDPQSLATVPDTSLAGGPKGTPSPKAIDGRERPRNSMVSKEERMAAAFRAASQGLTFPGVDVIFAGIDPDTDSMSPLAPAGNQSYRPTTEHRNKTQAG